MREETMLSLWVKKQMEEAAKYRDGEGKILGKIYEKVKRETQKEIEKRDKMEKKK